MKRFLWRAPVSKWRAGYMDKSLWFYGFSFGKFAVGWLHMKPGGAVQREDGRWVPTTEADSSPLSKKSGV